MAFFTTNFGTLNTAALLVETKAGATAATSFHIVIDSVSVALNGSGTGSANITFSGNAPFTSATSYAGAGSLPSGATATATCNMSNVSGTTAVVLVVGDAAHQGTSITVPFIFAGT